MACWSFALLVQFRWPWEVQSREQSARKDSNFCSRSKALGTHRIPMATSPFNVAITLISASKSTFKYTFELPATPSSGS
jgi:hypothetical protein